MIEALYVYTLLLQVDLLKQDEYDHCLDVLFLKNTDNDLLLELEWSASDLKHVIFSLQKYAAENEMNYDILGQMLFQKLKKIFDRNETDIVSFAADVYTIWQQLPADIQTISPFYILNYADDSLSWGDVQQTKALYLQAFQYYEML